MSIKLILSIIITFILSTSANAVLVGRLAATPGGTDYQAYYDTEAKLTWLADANTAGTTMTWIDAKNWAAGLTINSVDGWRLANSDACLGSNCTGSEMGNLFYNVLGNTASSLTNTGPFSKVQSGHDYYWSATEDPDNTSAALLFSMGIGDQSKNYKIFDYYYAWAIQSGDVSAVPVPAAVWLFGSGLIGLLGIAKRKNRT